MLTDMTSPAEEDAPFSSFTSEGLTIHRQRLLTWHACQNVHDLGGLPLSGGGRTQWRAVVRADDLCQLTPEGQDALGAYGIRTVIDLRAHFELGQGAHPYRPPYAGLLRYLHLPPSGNEMAPLPTFVSAPSLGEGYVQALHLRQRQYGAILTAIAHAPDGGVVVHCVAGKDRTGLVVALLLALVGVPDALLAEDYALSGVHLRDTHHDVARADSTDPGTRTRLAVERLSPPAAVLAALASIRERFGSLEDYLSSAGVSPADMHRLQTRLSESATTTRQ
jgi:protein-tyrosine phosphatase